MRTTSDLRFTVRRLRGAPVFTAVALATLALGIGVNTSMFSLVHAVALRRLAGGLTRGMRAAA